MNLAICKEVAKSQHNGPLGNRGHTREDPESCPRPDT